MEQLLIRYFERFGALSGEETQAIVESMCVRSYGKGTVLLAAGEVSRECYFVLKGCVRQYVVVEGEEKTSNFFVEEDWVVSLMSFGQQVPADHYFGCVEDTVLVVGTMERESGLYAAFPRLERVARAVLEDYFGRLQVMMATYVTDTPAQRYLRLLETRPELIQRVPQYQLASYVGVKPESLSRMRKRMQRQAQGRG